MTSKYLPIKIEKKELLIDSREVAKAMDVDHGPWITNIVKKYRDKVAEEDFGIIHFKNGIIRGRGKPEKYALLTEEQALFLLTLSRNTARVVKLKANLVKAFSRTRLELEKAKIQMFRIQAVPGWEEERKQLKDSNATLMDAVKGYIERHSDELSDRCKKWLYNTVNNAMCKVLTGMNVPKYKREYKVDSFRDALPKEQLKLLEELESLTIRIINNTDAYPVDAVTEGAERLMLAA